MTHFERLAEGMVLSTSRRGYAHASVSAIIAAASVSRPTFYEYFEDREDCFVGTLEHLQGELERRVDEALDDATDQATWETVLRALVGYARAEPAHARFVMGEALSGGSRALESRERALSAIAGRLRRATLAQDPEPKHLPDLEPRAALGGIYRMIAARLRRSWPISVELGDELIGWVDAYIRPAAACRWIAPTPDQSLIASPPAPEAPFQVMPSAFGRGGPRASREQIAENQRMRVLYATAKLAETKGYNATTVVDIVKLAGVHAKTFYAQFADKQDAFEAAHELGFQQIMDVTVKAFFSVEGWPQRSWEAMHAFTQLLQASPLLAKATFVEAHAVGASAVQRIEDAQVAFLFFLQEGLVLTETPPPRVSMEAIIATLFEITYMQARSSEKLQIAGMLPQIAQIWLVPFLGAQNTDKLIDSRTTAKARRKAAPGKRKAPRPVR
jgi:AcrR family transcriptional regulator